MRASNSANENGLTKNRQHRCSKLPRSSIHPLAVKNIAGVLTPCLKLPQHVQAVRPGNIRPGSASRKHRMRMLNRRTPLGKPNRRPTCSRSPCLERPPFLIVFRPQAVASNHSLVLHGLAGKLTLAATAARSALGPIAQIYRWRPQAGRRLPPCNLRDIGLQSSTGTTTGHK